MTISEAMASLEQMGSEQTRKTYRRHGLSDPMFGVSFANLGKLKKQIKTDHALACELWATRNGDAKYLATMIADPAQADSELLDAWARDLDKGNASVFASFVAKTPLARRKVDAWTKSSQEWIASAGYCALAVLARDDKQLPDDYFAGFVERIEKGIHKARNRVRHEMNTAVIAIGSRNAALEKVAIAAAGRIGKVEVDHGDTDCKTPDAIAYIRKTRARAKK